MVGVWIFSGITHSYLMIVASMIAQQESSVKTGASYSVSGSAAPYLAVQNETIMERQKQIKMAQEKITTAYYLD